MTRERILRASVFLAMDKATQIQTEFAELWSACVGKSLDLKCTPEETVYLTQPRDALAIQDHIKKLNPRVRTFVDCFACVGGDSLAAMFTHPNAHVYAIQRTKTAEETARFKRLESNLREFRRQYRCSGKVHAVPSDIGNWLARALVADISVLFLDPPWALDTDPRKISPMEDIRAFLDNNVFRFLQCIPKLIVLKLPPGPVPDIASWPGEHWHLRGPPLPIRRGRFFVYSLEYNCQ